jgi:hypothetical protein
VVNLEMRSFAVALSVVLIAWSAGQALLGVGGALIASPLAPWSADPIVWCGELVLAACSGLLGFAVARFIVRRYGAGSAGSANTMLGIGLGFLAVGILGIASGWLGLRVPTRPGSDVLERGEPLAIIFGLIAVTFGALVTFAALGALAAMKLRRHHA